MNTSEADADLAHQLAQEAIGVAENHTRTRPPSDAAYQKRRHFEFCSCGWQGYPYRDHLQLMMARWVIATHGLVSVREMEQR